MTAGKEDEPPMGDGELPPPAPPAPPPPAPVHTAVQLGQDEAGDAKQARLRIEYITDREARHFSAFTYCFSIALFVSVCVLVYLKYNTDETDVLFKTKDLYIANVAMASVGLSLLLALSAWFYTNWRSTRAGRASWGFRRQALSRSAGILLGLEMVAAVCWLAPYAIVVAQECMWFGDAVAVLAYIRWTAYNSCFCWLCVMMHTCCRYRGPDPPADPDHQLVMDISPMQKLRVHAPKLAIWIPFQGLVIVATVMRLTGGADVRLADADAASCRDQKYSCNTGSGALVLAILQLVFLGMYACFFLFFLFRAFRDHEELPFARYRVSNLAIRLVARHGTSAFFTTFLSVVVLTTVHFHSCWSYLDAVLGLAPVELSLILLSAVVAISLMPQHGDTRDMLTTWRQQFAWTMAELPAAVAARDAQLLQHQGPPRGLQRLLSKLPRVLSIKDGGGGASRPGSSAATQQRQAAAAAAVAAAAAAAASTAAGAASGAGAGAAPAAAADQGPASGAVTPPASGSPAWAHLGAWPFGQEDAAAPNQPMFCLELAIRLYSWAMYAYRHWPDSLGGMSTGHVMGLFDLPPDCFEALHAPGSDSRAVLGWRRGEAVVCSFRGTSSRTNVVTDIKAWTTPVLPKRWNGGQLVKVHAGFSQAYYGSGLQGELLAALERAGFTPATAFRLHLTGHSLGGALALLAAYDLKHRFPLVDITLVVFGAPRAGNRAFARHYRALVPDSWAVVNGQDPVPRLPGAGFRHATLLVRTGFRGDLIVRPSYFERSVISRSGGNFVDHQMGRYAMSLARAIKAQFSASKWVPGGKAGAGALARALDLNAALRVLHMEPGALQDPGLKPRLAEAAAARTSKQLQQQAAGGRCAWMLGWCSPGPRRTDSTLESIATDIGRSSTAGGSSGDMAAAAAVEAAAAEESAGLMEDEQELPPHQQQLQRPAWVQEASAFRHDSTAVVVEGVGEVVRGARDAAIQAATTAEGWVSRLQ